MAKHFKSKKIIRKLFLIKYIFAVICLYLLVKICIYFLMLVSPVQYYYPKLLLIDSYSFIKDNTVNKPVNLLNYKYKKEEKLEEPVISILEDKKKIYIYSTHQSEKYADGKNIVTASKYFKKQLEMAKVEVVVEDGNIQEFLNANNYSYNYSYVASRYFIEEEIKTNDYDLIIDLHRDAISKSSSTTTIHGKKCAKIMFVIGKKNKNYKKNYNIANQINSLIEQKYPDLTRGILLQTGEHVNGIYNQDLADNIILIELGGNKNDYTEVQNTLDLIAPIIGEYLYGETL